MTDKSPNQHFTRWILVGLGGVVILAAIGFFSAVPSESITWFQPHDRSGSQLKILPSPAYSFHELQVSGPAVPTLARGRRSEDESRPRLVWSVNGVDVDGSLVLASSAFRRGDLVRARIEVPGPDGVLVSDETSIVIANAAPHVRAAFLKRPANQPHQVTAHVEATDPDGDPLDYEFTWLLDGKPWPGTYGRRVDVSKIDSGASIQVKVSVGDGEAVVEHLTSPLGVDNQPPSLEVAGTPEIESDANGQQRAVLGARSEDPDGDDVTIEAVDAPAGVRWDAQREALVWSVVDGTERFDVILRASDPRGGQAERTITLSR